MLARMTTGITKPVYQILKSGCQRPLGVQATPESHRHVIRISPGLLLMESGESVIMRDIGNLMESTAWLEYSF